MTGAASARLTTADDLLRMPDNGNRYELVRGELVRVSPSSVRSNWIAIQIAGELSAFVRRGKFGAVGGSEGGFRLASDPDTVRVPDVWFIRAERIPPEGLPDAFWPGAPDLVVEVLSPSDRSGQIVERLNDYFRAGTRLAWLIDPRTRAAVVFHADHMPAFVTEDGVLDGEDVLPGFTLRLRDVLP